MEFKSVEKVDYDLYTTPYNIKKNLPKLLNNFDTLSFDTETRSLYGPEERKEAKEYLKEANVYDPYYKQARVASESSGLSFPSITKTTHFIFGESINKSHIFICDNPQLEIFIWKQVANYKGKLLIHNTLFDLKACFQKVDKIPSNIIDTALLVKCMINHVDTWKAEVGLKELVGSYYPPSWSLYADYEPTNLKDEKFLKYCAYDGSAVLLLYDIIQEELKKL